MDGFWTDLRYGVRRLAVTPGFTLAAVLTLGLGIGANVAIYSVVDSLLFRPLPYRQPDRLVQLNTMIAAGMMNPNLRFETFAAWREQTDLFAQLEAFDARSQVFQSVGEPQHIQTAGLTGGMMQMLGVEPLLGRGLIAGDAFPGRAPVAVIGEALWRREFGRRPDVLGATIRLDDTTYEIVGVMREGFRFPYMNRQVWVPMIAAAPAPGSRATRFETVGRLKEGVTFEAARERVKTLGAGVPPVGPGAAAPSPVDLTRFMQRRVNKPVEQALYALFGAVAVLLLIACANIANLLLVQGASRSREVALRASLGAARARLVCQLLTETVLLASVGGVVGVMAAMWGVDLLRALAPPAMTYFTTTEIALDSRGLLFALAITTMTAVLFGTLPALKTSRPDLHAALKAGVRSATAGPQHARWRSAFVVAQLALSLLLLVAAGLLTRTFVQLTRIDPGFRTDGLVAATLSLPSWKYRTAEAKYQVTDLILDRLRAVPGASAVTLSDGLPPGGGGVRFGMKIQVDDRGTVLDDRELLLPTITVSPDYFSLLGIPVLRGRAFNADDTATSARVLIINELMAKRLWGEVDPVGRRIRFSEKSPWYTIAGVVGDVYQFEHSNPKGMFNAYSPLSQAGSADYQRTFVMRVEGDPSAAIAAARAQIWSVDPGQPIFRIETAHDMYDEFSRSRGSTPPS